MATSRIELALDRATQNRVQRRAKALRMPVADYLKQVIIDDLDRSSDMVPIEALFDLGASEEPTDIATRKHELIGEACEAARRRPE